MFKGDSKTFKFLSKPPETNIKQNGYRTAPTPKAGRVRVQAQAGDKCVVPAKSKPKKRKVLTEADQTGISMECVDWSDRSYGVQEVLQQYGSKMPILVRITEGYYHAQSQIEFSQGQVSI